MGVAGIENEPNASNQENNEPPATENHAGESSNWLFWKYLMILISFAVPTIAITMEMIHSPLCDMHIAANRDFNRFYGIGMMKNHFTTPAADECDSNIIFRPALPQNVLKSDHSASSFLTLARYGTGKTRLRCEYYQSLNSSDYLKVLVLNQQISQYLDRFVLATSPQGRDCLSTNCLVKWSDQEFTQLILSSLVTEVVTQFHREQPSVSAVALDEKIDLIAIICYYYNGLSINELEAFVNRFLDKSENFTYRASQAQVQTRERNLYYDKPLFTQFKSDLKRIPILSSNQERLQLLLAVIEGEEFQHRINDKHMHGHTDRDLIRVTGFIRDHWKKSTVFIIDGIDENRYFFQQNDVNKASLETFCRSSVSQEILAMVMANQFYLSIFYPNIDGINIEESIARKDKFPIYTINWNPRSLSNYADYVLQEMDKNASSSRCRTLTNFRTLLNSSDPSIAEIIEKIPTPRALHFFMSVLVREMNNEASFVQTPFIATLKSASAAYEEASKSFHKLHKIKE